KTTGLPKEIMRLLWLGGGAVGAFLIFTIGWAVMGEITTTVRLPGVLSPTAPTYDVQHERGGRIAALHVRLHDEVSAGQLLFELDASDEEVQRAALQRRAALLKAELAAIAPRLEAKTQLLEQLEIARGAVAAGGAEQADPVDQANAAREAALAAAVSPEPPTLSPTKSKTGSEGGEDPTLIAAPEVPFDNQAAEPKSAQNPLHASLARPGAPRAGEAAALASVQLAYLAQDTAFAANLAQISSDEAAVENRLLNLTKRKAAHLSRFEITRARYARGAELSQKGLLPRSEFEALARELHETDAQLLAFEAEALTLSQTARELSLRRTRLIEERRERLAKNRLTHERDLIDTEARIARLTETIERAAIHAPVAGKVTALALDTEGLVAGPGMTLAVVTQASKETQIDVFVPPSYIDQVRQRQEGLLTIPALPQRTAPKLRVTLEDLAREPMRDQNGNSLHYLARATINREDLALARVDLGPRFQLSVGMPVSLAMNGRDTTLWQFLTGPFTGLLGAAFED
ncbi:MAG: HlyD family efflux transporter periplasmic adaptor subunit, partial [Pseudomonadota bacterium]